jgi:hypothetical protein
MPDSQSVGRTHHSVTVCGVTAEYTWNPASQTMYINVYRSAPGWTMVMLSLTLTKGQRSAVSHHRHALDAHNRW